MLYWVDFCVTLYICYELNLEVGNLSQTHKMFLPNVTQLLTSGKAGV